MTSPTIRFELLGPDDYDRGKKVLDRARHPGFIGRESFHRCATRGRIVIAVTDAGDVGIAMIDHKGVLGTLSVVVAAQKQGIGSALVRWSRPAWVNAIADRIAYFERLGYRPVGAAKIGASGKMSTQLMQLSGEASPTSGSGDDSAAVVSTIGVGPERESTANGLRDLPLVEFIPRVSPQFRAPYHLALWCDMIERCLVGGVRGLCAIPIRHHKTLTTLHGVAKLLLCDPTIRVLVMCADHERAKELGKILRRICESVAHLSGEPIGPTRGDNIIDDWKNEKGGGVVCMSAEQSKLGRDVDVLFVDDALTEKTCNDPLVRDAVDNAIAHYTMRAGRTGRRGSVLIVMSRWNDDDPIGRRQARKVVEWEDEHVGAILDMGQATERAFAPDVMTLEEINLRRAELREVDPSERLFWAQLMNDPKVQVDARFLQPHRYSILPTHPGFRYAMGVDLAYSPGEGDYFALVVVKLYGSTAYVVDVVRERADFNILENLIRNRWELYGRCPIFSYISGPEKGAIRYFTDRGIPMQGLGARYSKATRAQKTIDRWNGGKILLPEHAMWVDGFIRRCLAFTGHVKARDDDEIDALVSVCDGMLGSDAANMPRAFGRALTALHEPDPDATSHG